MRWNGKKIGTYSAIFTALVAMFIVFLFGLHPFGCQADNFENCLTSISITGVVLYLSIYALIWLLVRFGNLGGVNHDDQF